MVGSSLILFYLQTGDNRSHPTLPTSLGGLNEIMRKDRVLSDSKGLQRLHNSYPNAAQKVIEPTGLLPNEAKESWTHPLKEQGSSSPANVGGVFCFFF